MKNISTGFGLCVLGLGIAFHPILDRIAAPLGHAAPTIVWCGALPPREGAIMYSIFRAWSDGKIEAKTGFVVDLNRKEPDHWVGGPWVTLENVTMGTDPAASRTSTP